MNRKTKNFNKNGFKKPLGIYTGDTMKNIILGLLVVNSVQSFAITNTELFGEYPAKYFCIKVNSVVKKCTMPKLSEINLEISRYKASYEDRMTSLQDFVTQNDSYKDTLERIAGEKERNIGFAIDKVAEWKHVKENGYKNEKGEWVTGLT